MHHWFINKKPVDTKTNTFLLYLQEQMSRGNCVCYVNVEKEYAAK